MSQLIGEVDHSAHNVAAFLRERQVKNATKMEQLRVMTNTLQQSQSSLQYELKQDQQEEN